jgi:hypothetical protein
LTPSCSTWAGHRRHRACNPQDPTDNVRYGLHARGMGYSRRCAQLDDPRPRSERGRPDRGVAGDDADHRGGSSPRAAQRDLERVSPVRTDAGRGGGATWKRSFLSRGSCSDTFSPTELPAARSVILRFPSVTSARALWPGLSTSELMMLIDYCGGVSVPSVISAINFLPCALTEAAR